MPKKSKPFTRSEKAALRFLKEFFELSDYCTIDRKTKLSDLSSDLHKVINFSFQLEKRYSVELTDEEGETITLGTIADYLRIMRCRRLLTVELLGA